MRFRLSEYLLNRQLLRLEREAGDELLQVLEGGPEYYSNQELHLLLEQLKRQVKEANQFNKKRLLVGGSISLWIGAGFLCGALGWYLAGYLFLALVPLTAIAYLAATIAMHRRFRTYKHSRLVEAIIFQELERRRKDASIF
jgi:hypothetical protein